MVDDRWRFAREELEELDGFGLKRKLRRRSKNPGAAGRVMIDSRELIDLASNDYLGIHRDPRLARAMADAAMRWGVGSTASRLISGNTELHEQAESDLADFHATASALTFSSGYAAGVGVLPALASRGDFLYLDRLCHACLYDGARLSGATLRRFRHNDSGQLESLLQKDKNTRGRKVVVTDSVFSMDGDRAPLGELAGICRCSGALLVADEAHAVGVLGPEGRGQAAAEGLDLREDVLLIGTLGKAFGVAGAYVACTHVMRDYLINCSRSFIFSTAPPPPVLAAVSVAVGIVRAAQGERERLRKYSSRLRERLDGLGVDTLNSTTQIVPAVVGGASSAVAVAEKLRSAKIFAPAMRPPTVPPGTSRIRFSLSAALGEDDFQRVIEALSEIFPS